jgi:hypothetical protein
MTTATLYWIPLGAGTSVVRASGRSFEALAAMRERRPRRDLYHAALIVTIGEQRFTVEQAPVPDRHGDRRGVVAGGAVGSRSLGRFRIFRYEIRCWRDGRIPDLGTAVGPPVVVSHEALTCQRIVDTLPLVPTPVWGRDELHAGEMWNSNSIIAWTLRRSGIDAASLVPPPGGRAPGWRAGVVVARRATSPGDEAFSVP